MKLALRVPFLLCTLLIAVSALPSGAQSKPDRQVAITIDDLPAASNTLSAAEITALTTRLLTTLRDQKVPVVGFVNEKKLYRFGETDERIRALRMWLDYGFDLGNHTYTHMSLNKAGLKAWEDDVIQGESVTTLLLAEKKMKMRYFRHPFLDVGRDLKTRRDAEAFLVGRGYHIAPITLDGWDWAFATVYEDAKKRGDQSLQKQLADAYLAYSDGAFAFAEQLSKQVVGYEAKQILLIHANQLEADHIGELLDLFRKRGYRFIALDDALGDPAYSMPNEFVGEYGTGWLEQLAITQGKPPQGAPEFPQWVLDKRNAIQAAQPPPAPGSTTN